MDKTENKDIVDPQEDSEDQKNLEEIKEDELREKLAEDFGIDPEENQELLDKLVERDKAHHEKLTGAIKQKRKWRERAENKFPKKDPKKDKPNGKEEIDIDEMVSEKLNKVLEERDLKDLNLPEQIEEEVKKLAKINGVSVREAANDPYIKFKKEQLEQEERIKSATPKRGGKSGTFSPKIDPSKPLNPSDFDFNSKEGVEKWNQAKANRRKWQEENS